MTPLEIRFLLASNDITQSDVARSCGVTQPSVQRVIEGVSRSRLIEERISAMTGQPLHVLWPQWFAADGSRIKRRKRHGSAIEALARLRELQANAAAANREAA